MTRPIDSTRQPSGVRRMNTMQLPARAIAPPVHALRHFPDQVFQSCERVLRAIRADCGRPAGVPSVPRLNTWGDAVKNCGFNNERKLHGKPFRYGRF